MLVHSKSSSILVQSVGCGPMGERKGSVCARAFATEKAPTVREPLVDKADGEKHSRETNILITKFLTHDC